MCFHQNDTTADKDLFSGSLANFFDGALNFTDRPCNVVADFIAHGVLKRNAAGLTDYRIYATAFRRKVYASVEQLQADVNEWLDCYNRERTHSGKHCFGKTPWQTFLDSKTLALEKQLDQTPPTASSLAASV